MVHASFGQLEPLSKQMRSEPWIIAGIAEATLGNHPVSWQAMRDDYRLIRDAIARTVPGFDQFEDRLKQPGGFHLPNSASQRVWRTSTEKARFSATFLPDSLVHEKVRASGQRHDLIVQSLRSHDQYNTTIYSLNDRYRGVSGQREVLFINQADIDRLGFEAGEKVDLVSLWDDRVERKVRGFTLLPYDIPEGQAAAYYPEINPLVPLDSFGVDSFTPASKFIPIKLLPGERGAKLELTEA